MATALRRSAAAWIGLAFSFLSAVPVGAQPATASDTALADVEAELRAYVDRQNAPVGIVAGVIGPRGRRVVSYGQRDRCQEETEDGCLVRRGTLFEIGSLTKVFTALLLADLVKEGVVDLDDPVEEHLPVTVNLPEAADAITLRHLATHTSGLPRLQPNLNLSENPDDPYTEYTVKDLYQAVSRGDLDAPPGEEYAYSNYAYGLLGHALTRAAGAASYEAAVRQRLLEPLGMKATRATFADTSALAARRARGHDAAGRAAGDWHFTDAGAGAGAMWSDADDLFDFLAANIDPEEAPAPLQDAVALTHEQQHATGENAGVALGWHLREGGGKRYYWHNGGTGGFRSFIGFNPEQEVGVVVLANTARSVDDIGWHLLDQKTEIAQVPFNTYRRPTVEVGYAETPGGADAPSVRLTTWIGDFWIFKLRPFVGYSRFGVEGQPQQQSEGSPVGGAFVFESAEVGLFAETGEGLTNYLLGLIGLPGRVYVASGLKMNAFLRAERYGEVPSAASQEVSSLFSRWAFQWLDARVGYRKGRLDVAVEGWGRRRYLGSDQPLDAVGRSADVLPRIMIGYTF